MDVHTKAKRTEIMRAVKSKDTEPEMKIRRLIHSNGFRYSLHKKTLPGIPDIYLKKYNTVIFVNGCFWHQHQGCKKSQLPKSNTEYWNEKLEKNRKRDKENIQKLKELNYNVIIIWECELKRCLENSQILFESITKGIPYKLD